MFVVKVNHFIQKFHCSILFVTWK